MISWILWPCTVFAGWFRNVMEVIDSNRSYISWICSGCFWRWLSTSSTLHLASCGSPLPGFTYYQFCGFQPVAVVRLELLIVVSFGENTAAQSKRSFWFCKLVLSNGFLPMVLWIQDLLIVRRISRDFRRRIRFKRSQLSLKFGSGLVFNSIECFCSDSLWPASPTIWPTLLSILW